MNQDNTNVLTTQESWSGEEMSNMSPHERNLNKMRMQSNKNKNLREEYEHKLKILKESGKTVTPFEVY